MKVGSLRNINNRNMREQHEQGNDRLTSHELLLEESTRGVLEKVALIENEYITTEAVNAFAATADKLREIADGLSAAVADEYLQKQVLYRLADIYDLCSDKPLVSIDDGLEFFCSDEQVSPDIREVLTGLKGNKLGERIR